MALKEAIKNFYPNYKPYETETNVANEDRRQQQQFRIAKAESTTAARSTRTAAAGTATRSAAKTNTASASTRASINNSFFTSHIRSRSEEKCRLYE